MSIQMAKQVGLLAAGCQPWNFDVCSASGNRFAYCATLAIYIYELDHKYNEYKLHAILAEHKKTITSIAWNPRDPDMIASCSTDRMVYIWNLTSKTVVASTELKGSGVLTSVAWNPHDQNIISFAVNSGQFMLWNCSSPSKSPTLYNKDSNFSSPIACFRWHHNEHSKLAFGHKNGSLSFFHPSKKCQKHCLMPENVQQGNFDTVNEMEWDCLSNDYLLVANASSGMRLIDSQSLTTLMQFKLPSSSSHIHTFAWLKNAPGMFITGDTETGVLRIWNVSKSYPVESIKVKRTAGFHVLCVLDTVFEEGTSNGPYSPTGSANSSEGDVLPPARIVCTFADGGVGLYNLEQRRWEFLRDLGHVETIFDCKFKPNDPNLLATASFDGTIKVWDINSLTAKFSSPGNSGIIYSISWAPADLNLIVASTSRNGAFIWDLTKGKIVKTLTAHGKNAIYSTSWNQKDPKKIATCGADSYCVIHLADGKVLKKYKHPRPVFGCEWSPNNKDMIATGCEDMFIRIFMLTTNSDAPLKKFQGHANKVFHIRWSPLREGMLCSGSDDCTVRVWDYTQDSRITVLRGHTSPVRGLIWHPEIPYLLISGSWDSTIRIWDIRCENCIDTILDHGADVYGLTIHPCRPFTLASSSRDSTVRVWYLSNLASHIYINLLAKRPSTEVIGSADDGMIAQKQPVLCGYISRQLQGALGSDTLNQSTLRKFSEFLMPPIGVRNFWNVLEVLLKENNSLLPPDYDEGILHIKHLSKYKTSEAQQLESVKMSEFAGGVGVLGKDERLRKAAEIYLKLGQVEKYCELLIEIGEWDKALSVAPSVSMNYWKSLAERRANYLAKEGSDNCLPYLIATGKYENLISLLQSKGRLHEAVLIAQVACTSPITYDDRAIAAPTRHLPSLANKNTYNKLLDGVVNSLANRYFVNGQPVIAATCHLSNNQYKLAMSRLIKGNELELAVSLGIAVREHCGVLFDTAVQLLSRKCEKLKRWDLSIELLQQLSDSKTQIIMTCARYSSNKEDINSLYALGGLKAMDYYDNATKTENSSIITKIQNQLLSSNPEQALNYGIKIIKELMSKEKWNLDKIHEIIRYLSCIRAEKLLDPSLARKRTELLAYASLIGAFMSIRMGYNLLTCPLFLNAKSLIQRDGLEFPMSMSKINSYILAVQKMEPLKGEEITAYYEDKVDNRKLDKQKQQELFDELREMCDKPPETCLYGPVVCTGSCFPSHSDVNYCTVTDTRIHGSAFFLENGKSSMALDSAIMWALVNPFSPLNTGALINPF